MKKIISILACVCLLLSVMIVPVSAADGVTISFADGTNRTSYSTEQQVWEQNGITVTNNKSSSTSNVRDNVNDGHIRCYKGSEVIVEYPAMTALVISAINNYAAWDGSFTDSNATASVSGTTITITFAEPVDSFTFAAMSAQCRATSMTVYTGDVCVHDDCAYTSNGDETHTIICNNCGETVNAAAECVDSDKDGTCDTCTGDVALPFDPTGKTPAEIVDAAYALETGEAFETSATLTGVITVVNTPYSDQYSNVTVTIVVEGKEDKPIECYRLKGEGADTITIDDTITVTGILKNYNGKIEFDQGCTLDAVVKGDFEVVVPTDPKEIVDAAFALEAGTSLLYTATLQGEVVEINTAYDEGYGNVTLTISVEGTDGMKDLLCYRLKAGEGADASTVKVGDIIEVTGNIKNYNGTIEYDSGCTFVMIEEYVEETFEGTDPDAPIELAVDLSTLKEIKVPAGGTVFVQAADANGIFHVTSATGSYMLINGMQNQLEADGEADLTLCGYEMVNIYNPSETDTITLYVCLEAGEGEVFGTWDNPEVLELMENPMIPSLPPSAQATTELEAGNQGYFYKIVATEDGAFTITVSAYDVETFEALGYQLSVTNNTTGWQSDYIARAADAEDYYDQLIVPVTVGDEILINAGTFDANDTWNAPAGAINVTVGFMANGSQNLPFVLEDTGAQETTINEGSQGAYYEWVATADGTVTVTMNDEAGWQYCVNKTPVDVDDYANYYSGDTHWYNDDPVVATETVDVVVGETVKVWVNTYDPANEYDAPAGTVNWTFDFAEKVENAKISVSDADAVAGKTFTVTIDISNNPGIIGAKLNVNYDTEVLELVSAVAGDFANGSVNAGDEVIPNYNFSENITDYPYVINWTDPLATENTTTNGTFAVLTFKVKGTAAEGTTEISVTFDEGDIVDAQLNDVAFETVASTVTITVEDSVSGDANGDGSVNGRDYALMLQSINGWEVNIDKDAADVTGDGAVNGRDYALLLQYINGWDVTLK